MDQTSNVNVDVDTSDVERYIMSQLAQPGNKVIRQYQDVMNTLLDRHTKGITNDVDQAATRLSNAAGSLGNRLEHMQDIDDHIDNINDTNVINARKLLGITMLLVVFGCGTVVLGLYMLLISHVWRCSILTSALHSIWVRVATGHGVWRFLSFLIAVLGTVVIVSVPLAVPLFMWIVYVVGKHKQWWY